MRCGRYASGMAGSASQITAAIVCKDNAATIGRTLASLRGVCGSIVAVDSGSCDATVAMLEEAGARVIHSPWLGHVKTKQLALEACATPWALCIDSDESIEPDLATAIARGVENAPESVAGFLVNRKVYYRGRPLKYAWQPEWRCRLVRPARARWGGVDPHDVLSVTDGSTRKLKGTLRHDSFETFMQQLGKQVSYARLQADGMHAAGTRATKFNLLVSPGAAFLKQLVLKRAFMDGGAGWMAAACAGAQALMKHVALLELEQIEALSRNGSESRAPMDRG
ncbi:N/A [soil metagenome]